MARQLTADHEAVIERIVASGQYTDADQVIGEALRLLESRAHRLDTLRALLAVGEDQEARGEMIEFTPDLFEELTRSAHEKARAGHLPNPDVCP